MLNLMFNGEYFLLLLLLPGLMLQSKVERCLDLLVILYCGMIKVLFKFILLSPC